jgi:hypothetical protein
MTSNVHLLFSLGALALVILTWFFILLLNAHALRERKIKLITREEFLKLDYEHDRLGKYASIIGFGTYLLAFEFSAREESLIWSFLISLALAEAYRHSAKQRLR